MRKIDRKPYSAREVADDENTSESDLRRFITSLETLCEWYEGCECYPVTQQEDAPNSLKKRVTEAARKKGMRADALTRSLVEQGLDAMEKETEADDKTLDID